VLKKMMELESGAHMCVYINIIYVIYIYIYVSRGAEEDDGAVERSSDVHIYKYNVYIYRGAEEDDGAGERRTYRVPHRSRPLLQHLWQPGK
jgi:hypothetical protein